MLKALGVIYLFIFLYVVYKSIRWKNWVSVIFATLLATLCGAIIAWF